MRAHFFQLSRRRPLREKKKKAISQHVAVFAFFISLHLKHLKIINQSKWVIKTVTDIYVEMWVLCSGLIQLQIKSSAYNVYRNIHA